MAANILTNVDSYFKTVKSYFWPVAFPQHSSETGCVTCKLDKTKAALRSECSNICHRILNNDPWNSGVKKKAKFISRLRHEDILEDQKYISTYS